MKLSPEEERFLRHWMHDEAHFQEGRGPAKELQLRHQVRPADLAVLIVAAMPDPQEQYVAGYGPPPSDPPIWPWSERSLQDRLAEARAILAQSQACERMKNAH